MSDAHKKTGASLNRGNSETVVGTPRSFVTACELRYGPIVFDLAASAHNHKRGRFFSKEDNSLIQGWSEALAGHIGWLNPPYDKIAPWARKADFEARLGARVLMLVPASVGSNWYRDYIHDRYLVVFINGRIRFVGHKSGYPKDLMLIGFGMKPGFEIWMPGKAALKETEDEP